MAEIEAFVVAFGTPAGLALWIIWQSRQQAKSGDNTSMSSKIDAIDSKVDRMNERLSRLEGAVIGARVDQR